MGSRGPAPTPTKILKLHGSWRGDLNPNEPAPSDEPPTCPSVLNARAKAEWKRVTKSLAGMGLLSADDRVLIAAYCVTWAEFIEATVEIETSGLAIETPKGLKRNPYVLIRDQATAKLLRLAGQFGLSPSARSRITAPGERRPDAEGKERFFNAG